MESLELRNETYRVVFRYAGRKFGYSLNTADLESRPKVSSAVSKRHSC